MSERNEILEPSQSPEQLVEAMERAIDDIQQHLGLAFEYAYAEEDEQTTVHIWRELVDSEALIRVTDDRGIPARYLTVEAIGDERVDAIVEHIARQVALVPLQRLSEEAARRMEDDPGALIRLAVAAGDGIDDESAAVLERGLHSQDRGVREAAVMAAGLTRFPRFRPELERLRDAATDPAERRYIELAIADCGGAP